MADRQEQVHIVPLSLPPLGYSQHTGSPDHICFAVAGLKRKEVVSLARESLAAYQNFQDMSGVMLLRFGLRMLADSYELVVVGHRRILDPDTLAADRTYSGSESMDAGVATEALYLQSTVQSHCMLSQHVRSVVAADHRKCV
jgi:hypothetical protein